MAALSRGNLRMGFDAMRRAKWRSFWTMLGVIIGVSSVITVVSIGEGVKQQISGQIKQTGSDLITIRPAQLQSGGAGITSLSAASGFAINGVLSAKDADSVRALPQIDAATPLTAVSGKVQADTGAYSGGLVIGTSPDLPRLLNHKVAFGAFFADDETDQPLAVLGASAAEHMFNEAVPLGRNFTFRGQTFSVRGILQNFKTTPLSSDADFNSAIFISNTQAQILTNKTAAVYEILAKPKNTKDPSAAVTAITNKLSKLHNGQGDFSVLRQDQAQTANNDILNLLTSLVAGVAAISLIVGGIGIMNVMSVAVVERLHEIGIRKAVGATNRQILNQFVIEATTLSLTGGIIGIIIAAAVNAGLRAATNLQPVLSWQVVLLATAVSVLIGVVFGSFPAIKAARKDPIEALRAD